MRVVMGDKRPGGVLLGYTTIMRIRLVLYAFAAFLWLGCSDARPSPPTLPDSGPDIEPGDTKTPDVLSPSDARGPEPKLPDADTEIVLAYGAPSTLFGLDATADPSAADVVFLIDTTSSFREEIDNLQRDMTRVVIPGIRARVPNSSFGVAAFEDFPAADFGSSTDRPFTLETAVTSSLSSVEQAVAKLDDPLGHGGDYPESGLEALWQLSTGDGFVHQGQTLVAPYSGHALVGGGTLGGAGFRQGALHIVILATDALFHTPSDYEDTFSGVHGLPEAIAAMNALDIFAVSMVSDPEVRGDPAYIAVATHAVMAPIDEACPTGLNGQTHPPLAGVCPLVFDIKSNGSGTSSTLVDAVVALVNSLEFQEVHAEIIDDPLGFVRSVEASSATVPFGIPMPGREDRQPPFDGVFDTFVEVGAGVTLRFEVTLKNDLLPSAPDYPHIFRVPIEVVGDGIVLSRTTLRIIVPAMPSNDGGVDDIDGGP